MYQSERCGICNKPIKDMMESLFWPSPISRWAHIDCYTFIHEAENDLLAFLDTKFPANFENNKAHIRYVRAVQKTCGSLTILEYAREQGISQLKNLFDTVGKKAALES